MPLCVIIEVDQMITYNLTSYPGGMNDGLHYLLCIMEKRYLTKYPQMWYNKYRKRKYNSYQLGR